MGCSLQCIPIHIYREVAPAELSEIYFYSGTGLLQVAICTWLTLESTEFIPIHIFPQITCT